MNPQDESDAAEPIEVGAYVARARRRADLSQRELARRVHVARSTVSRWETGQLDMRMHEFEAVLALAGLRLVVTDASGTPVAPFAADTVRDNANRRFPAHLDVAPPHQRPANRGVGDRYDRPPARAWYSLRRLRDDPDRRAQIARSFGESLSGPQARPDHPTVAELAAHGPGALTAGARLPVPRVSMDDASAQCTCQDGCFLETACLSTCRCQCETRWPA